MSMSVAGSRHVHALLGSLGRLARTPFSTGLTVLVIALALNSSAASPDPADNGPDQDTVDQLGFSVYRALERYGAIKLRQPPETPG